jgi:hypothetical protein
LANVNLARVGYVMCMNSNGSLTLNQTPAGKRGKFGCVNNNIREVLWRSRGLMEAL